MFLLFPLMLPAVLGRLLRRSREFSQIIEDERASLRKNIDDAKARKQRRQEELARAIAAERTRFQQAQAILHEVEKELATIRQKHDADVFAATQAGVGVMERLQRDAAPELRAIDEEIRTIEAELVALDS
jgi:hypothetical protein